nr:hypothetical protein [uncultured Rhodoferax sp.]
MHRNLLSLALLSLLAFQAHAQNNASASSPTSVSMACQNDVSKFEQLVGVVRQTHGDKAAHDLREKLLPSKEADEALSQSGQCGLARLLRTKKLV